MAPAQFFARFGVFARPDFLTGEECRQLRQEMSAAPSEAAKVGLRGQPDPGTGRRRHRRVDAPEQPDTRITGKSLPVRGPFARPALALRNFFRRVPGRRDLRTEIPDLSAGRFCSARIDRRKPEEQGAEISKVRRINLILYLNRESATPAPAAYSGGCLTLYGLIDSPDWARIGFPIVGEPGLLVGFRSHFLHEVTPVLHGECYNIVSRFLDADQRADVLSDKAAGSAD